MKVSGGRNKSVAAALLALALVAVACSSGTPAGHASTSTTRAAVVSPAPGTSGTVGAATPPLEIAQASIEVSGANVTILFAPRIVTGRLRVTAATFANGGLRLTFSVTGVRYAGDATASGTPGDPVDRVVVSGTGSDATVLVDLGGSDTSHRFTIVRDAVSVRVS